MPKDNVYDLFTGRKLATDINTVEAIAKSGRYFGLLPKGDARAIREVSAQLKQKRLQIDPLIKEFNQLYEGYSYMLSGALTLLNMQFDEFDPNTQDMYVDEDGHCWAINANVE